MTEENPLEIIVKLNASETIGHVNVQIEAGDDLFGDAIKMMFGEAGTFDLAESGEYKETLTSLGFPVEEQVVGKTELDFVITQFTPLLRNFPSEKPHKFHITLIDRKGQSVSKTLTFTIKE